MAGVQSDFHAGGFVFFSGFDSGNLGKVELVEPESDGQSKSEESSQNPENKPNNPLPDLPEVTERFPKEDRHFKMWTRPDCQVTFTLLFFLFFVREATPCMHENDIFKFSFIFSQVGFALMSLLPVHYVFNTGDLEVAKVLPAVAGVPLAVPDVPPALVALAIGYVDELRGALVTPVTFS